MFLVLGAGHYQYELIQIAKEFGKVYALSNDRLDVGSFIADETEHISILDFKSCLEFASKKSILAILTSGSQLGAYTQARLNAVLKLDGFPLDFVKSMSDKLLMREWLKKNKFSKMQSRTTYSSSLFLNDWIIKPRIASGSRGVERFSSSSNLDEIGRKSYFLKGWVAEPFVEGVLGSALFVVKDGVPKKLFSTKKIVNNHFVPIAHFLHNFTSKENCHLLSLIQKMARDFNLVSGFIDVDFICNKDEVEVIDVGTRLSGNGLVEMYNLLANENLYREQIKMSLNVFDKNLSVLKTGYSGVIIYYSNRQGVLRSYNERYDDIQILAQKKFLSLGSPVSNLTEGKKQLGFFIFKCKSNSYQSAVDVTQYSTVTIE